jgi:hypothetical protein
MFGLCAGLGGGGATTLCGGGVIPGTGIRGGGGEVGEDGAVLELDEVLLDDVLGVVVEDEADDTVELESEVPTGGGTLLPLLPIVRFVLEIWCCCGD